jgi:hypothetical protein
LCTGESVVVFGDRNQEARLHFGHEQMRARRFIGHEPNPLKRGGRAE